MDFIGSSGENIRINGTGRLYVADVGSANLGMEVGEIDGLTDNISTESEDIETNRYASKATIKTVYGSTSGTVTFGMRESTLENIKLAVRSKDAVETTQAAGTINGTETTMVEKEYVDVGYLNCYITKVSVGTVTGGPFEAGETVTGGTSAATATVAWAATGYLELVNVSGTFVSGETVTGGTSSASAAASGVETKKDMVLVDAASPTTRYVSGTDYMVDADYGGIMKMPGGSIGTTAFVHADYEEVTVASLHSLSAGVVEKKLTFVSDVDDNGPRVRVVYQKVSLSLDGDSTKLGDGEQVLPMTGTILADTTQPDGEQYIRTDLIQ